MRNCSVSIPKKSDLLSNLDKLKHTDSSENDQFLDFWDSNPLLVEEINRFKESSKSKGSISQDQIASYFEEYINDGEDLRKIEKHLQEDGIEIISSDLDQEDDISQDEEAKTAGAQGSKSASSENGYDTVRHYMMDMGRYKVLDRKAK